ncbi:ATP-binding cassette sub-family F member 1 [Blastocystis sp. ATCC 50177/Nand II]|uniref:ATP-binding cassette sub-family F member 1 n=1 Tax=Blastocystis sp. subtype 1 (strain ATCC 50177 / NandII) TaxID=478820 RepID=A0A196S733_BLAHN|nr:ATP-binding cassette sub-family F member 1 [Blastocystis sp. ATCC 50177/Nand II]
MNHHHYFIQSLSNRMDAYVDVEDQHWGGAAPDQFSCTQRPWNKDDPAWINSKDINVEGFSINAKGKPLFENADLKIIYGRRYGLLGPNGQGKSTLLKMIACRELAIPPNLDILYVEQEAEADDSTAVEAVLKADTKRTELLKREKELQAILDSEENDHNENQEAIVAEYNEVLSEMRILGVHKAEPRVRRILAGLGFTPAMQEQPTTSFSGGWRMRISLARALFMQPDLLLLDEPTNHLDLNAVIWLDNYLQSWKKTLLVVSHDQEFLSSVCQFIIHLENKKLAYYKGDYNTFKKMEQQKRVEQLRAYEKQQKQLKQLKIAGKSRNAAEDEAKQKRARDVKKQGRNMNNEEVNEEASTLIERPKEYVVKFTFPKCLDLAPPIISVENVTFGYSPDHILLRNVDFGIHMSSRISIVGPNGIGKSTLVKLIEGELTPLEGEVRRNQRLRIGKYSQHFVDKLPMDVSAVEYLQHLYPAVQYQDLRNLLGRYGLEGHAHTIPIKNLSGGQKARVTFAEISLSQPHVLMFDEPTNHLDIESIDALGEAINEFEGGVLVVSHDARLLMMTNCEMWLMDNQTVKPIEGGYEAYRDSLLEQMDFSDSDDDEVPVEKKEKKEKEEVVKEAPKTDEDIAALAFSAILTKEKEKKKKHHSKKEGEEGEERKHRHHSKKEGEEGEKEGEKGEKGEKKKHRHHSKKEEKEAKEE